MRVVVTGSEGFLGRYLVQALVQREYNVVRYDLQLGRDILDHRQLIESLTGATACIHLAAVADLYVADEDPEAAEEVNVRGTACVLDACDQLGVRLLYASTCCVYGNNGAAKCDEDSAAHPTELYARTKLDGEKLVRESAQPHSILRLATFYGPGMRPSLATSKFLQAARDGKPILIHGTGDQTRCFTHVSDICSGIIEILKRPTFHGTINISDAREVSVNELASIAMEVAGREVPTLTAPDRDGQIYRSAIDNRRLLDMGWRPRWTIEEGMRQCALAMNVEQRDD